MVDNKEQALVILSEVIEFYESEHELGNSHENEGMVKRAKELEEYIEKNLK
jgi:hypothetical protein